MRKTWVEVVGFTVVGKPAAQGSLSSFRNPKTNRIVTPQKKRVIEWRNLVAAVAADVMEEMDDMPVLAGAVKLSLTFMFSRPNSHYRSGRNADLLKGGAPEDHIQTPDLDKLVRAVKDALSGIVYKDDSQVCNLGGTKKIWVSKDVRPGVLISVQQRMEYKCPT